MESKIAVTGWKGRLGSELVSRGCVPLDCDVTSKFSIKQALHDVKPDIVIHCAAMTDVDKCEEYPDEAFEINAKGTENLKVCFDKKIIYISTDYVFDGRKGRYFEYQKPGLPENLCWYGYTKLLGEQVLGNGDTIVRTTMLYGSPVKEDFVTQILQKLELMNCFSVTRCLSGNPTYIPHLVDGIMSLINHPFTPGVINIVGRDLYSRYEFALVIASVLGYEDLKNKITPTNSIGKVKRPRHAGLSTTKARMLGIPIYSVVDGLKAFGENMRDKIFVQLKMPL